MAGRVRVVVACVVTVSLLGSLPVWAAQTALRFDGIDDYGRVPDATALSPHLGPSGQMTIEAWVYLSSLPPATGQKRTPVIAKGSSSNWEYALYVYSDGKVGFSLWRLNGYTCAEPRGGTITLNAWHHLAGTLSKGQFVRVSLAGQRVAATPTFSGESGNGTSPVYVARRGDGQYFKGTLDEIRLYNRALSQTEITAHYNNGLGQYGGAEANLVAGWHLDEGSGSSTSDYSGNAYTITLANGPLWTSGLVTAGGDTTPPAGMVTINSGAAQTNTPSVILGLSATDNSGSVAQMQFSNDGATYSSPEAYATTKSWTLTAGDGTKTVYARFKDAAGNWSTPATDMIVLDATPPAISSVSASGITQTAATITWTTNEAATSQVDYGTTTSYGQSSALDASLVTNHSVTVSGLSAGTLYHVRVRSKDAAGNEALSADATFTTLSADITPPSITVTWPPDGAILGAQ
jgi:hypothetical protein